MNKTAELVFIPTPGMGHLLSTVELAKLVLHRNECISISVYIIHLPNQAAKVNAYVDSQTRDNPYPTRLTFVTYPPLSIPPDPSMPHSYHIVTQLHKPLVKQAIEDRVKAGLPKPAGFVLDMFCVGMVDIANELNIPSYIFITTGVSLLNLMFYAQSLADDNGVDVATKFSVPDSSLLVPGFKNPVMTSVIPSALQDKGAWGEMLLNFARKFRETKGILVNTYMELEAFGIQELLGSEDKTIPPVYPVGPILELDNNSRGGYDIMGKESIMGWLDSQPKSSVVFLCFGSMGSFDVEQLHEIANGLDKSGYRFLWALRLPPPVDKQGTPGDDKKTFLDALPEGFVDRTTNKGKIIEWAPQIEVLAHQAIAGFVSHCGWNSVLESLWFGIPLATWPLYADHQLVAFKLVKELELAVEIRMDYKRNWKARKGNLLVTATEIENGVKNLMCMDEKMRERVRKMSDEGKKALQEGGSSYNWLGRFIEDVFSNIA